MAFSRWGARLLWVLTSTGGLRHRWVTRGSRRLAGELGLAIELSAAVGTFGGAWMEYGLIERAYA